MASSANINWEVVLRLASELRAMLKNPNVFYQTIDHHLELLRLAVTTVAFNNIRDENTGKAEAILWDVSCNITNRYRKALAKFKSDDQHKLSVERHKLLKRYANFIKTSQYFYKGYIQRLDAHFEGIVDLHKIAQRLRLAPLVVEEHIHSTPEIKNIIVHSVYATLLHLGDLSRYRNEVRTTDKTWAHALAYYSLASQLLPAHGSAYNQMAIIALQDQNHLDTVYHFYRSLATKTPHPLAKNNLELEFKKVISAWENDTRSGSSGINLSIAETAATGWLLRLHAMLYKGDEFPRHDEIETEFIFQTTTLLKDQAIQPEVLTKIALINIAAEYFALERLNADASLNNRYSYFSMLRLNVRTFFMLLEVLQPEFRSDEYEDLPGTIPESERITSLMKHVLPTLRHYSIWLVAQAETISGYTFGEANSNDQDIDAPLIDNLKIHVKEMFRLYASSLCLLCTAFTPKDLHEFSEVKYLLAEDAATLGFKPFTDRSLAPYCDIYYTDEGTIKPHVTDRGVEQEAPETEMMSRIKNIIRDGVVVAYNMDKTPIKIAEDKDGVFYFLEDRLPDILPTNGHSPGHSMSSLEMKRTLSERDQVRGHALGGTVLPDTEFTHDSVDQRMNELVTELVDSREDSYGMNTRVANDLLSGQPPENFIRSSRDVPARMRAKLMPSFAASAMLTPNKFLHSGQPLNVQRQEPTVESAQLANGHAIRMTTNEGIYGHRNQGPQFGDNNPIQSSNDLSDQVSDRRPKVAGGVLTSSEMELHVKMFNNPFGHLSLDSSWRNNPDIIAGTDTPYRSHANSLQRVTPTVNPPHPAYGGVGHYQSSPVTGVGFESSGAGIYGDSLSYEREMMLQSSFPALSGSLGHVQMQTPPGGQG